MKRREHEGELRKLLRSSPELETRIQTLTYWCQNHAEDKSNDREVVLLSYAFLEDALQVLLGGHLGILGTKKAEKLFGGNSGADGVLSSAYSRLEVSEALEIISAKTSRDIRTVTLIRNAFAHTTHHLDFLNPSVSALCAFETISDIKDYYQVVGDDGSIYMKINLETPRSRFIGFIILFWLFCSVVTQPRSRRVMESRFGPQEASAEKPIGPSVQEIERDGLAMPVALHRPGTFPT